MMATPERERMRTLVAEAADRVAEALKAHLPDDQRRHGLLGDFALVRNWAEHNARKKGR